MARLASEDRERLLACDFGLCVTWSENRFPLFGVMHAGG